MHTCRTRPPFDDESRPGSKGRKDLRTQTHERRCKHESLDPDCSGERSRDRKAALDYLAASMAIFWQACAAGASVAAAMQVAMAIQVG